MLKTMCDKSSSPTNQLFILSSSHTSVPACFLALTILVRYCSETIIMICLAADWLQQAKPMHLSTVYFR